MSLSMDVFFKDQRTLDKFHNCGFFSSYLDSFVAWLMQHKFSDRTIQIHITHVAHFSHSLEGSEPDIANIDDSVQTFLYKHMPKCSCKGWKRLKEIGKLSQSINRFKDYLSDCHSIDFQSEKMAYPEIHHEYLCWLNEELKLANSTIRKNSNCLKIFLAWYKESSNYQVLSRLTPSDVESYYINVLRGYGKGYRGSFQVTLRSFFGFCYERGHIKQNLRSSVPVIHSYRFSDVPKKIEDTEAKKLIDGIDRSTASGKRAYAIVLILYTYGVRGCQVRALKVKDIDWHKEEIHFPAAKNGKDLCLPLTTQVGNALLSYLKHARPMCRYKEVFLTLQAPVGPMTNLNYLMRSKMIPLGIKSPSIGSHCFRHGFVSLMLQQGKSLKHIADLIGHKHIKTTFIYTKIDFHSLADVALDLPEVDYENI